MDDLAVGRLLRAIRIRRNWRQTDVAEAAGVSRSGVSLAERGQLDGLRLFDLREIARALDVRLPFSPTWLGGERDRVLNERHASMQEHLARIFEQMPGWTCDQEVTFSVFGERGSIDALAWHAMRHALLVIELKTELADPSALLAQVDRYHRLAMGIARGRDWKSGIGECLGAGGRLVDEPAATGPPQVDAPNALPGGGTDNAALAAEPGRGSRRAVFHG